MKKPLLFLFSALFFVSCATMGGRKNVVLINAGDQEARVRQQVDAMVEKEGVVVKDKKEFKRYEIKPGDSLWKIAKKEAGKGYVWKNIAEDNGLKEPYRLKPGSEILIAVVLAGAAGPAWTKGFEYRAVKNKAFGVGEKLVFAIKYFGITVGYGVLEIKGIDTINGRKVYVIDATARTAPFFETFYRVKDIITSYMDMMGIFSWKYSKHLEEGGYRNDNYMEFKHKEKYAVKKDGTKCAVPSFVQDVLSELYYYRAVFTGKEEEMYIDTASDECKSYQIVVKKIGEEKASTDAGDFDCYHVRPFLKYEGIFRQKGDVDIWMTKDENKIPVLVKSKIVIGTIDAVLQEATVVKAE
jgi:hypothetical protein